jgi:hypothetical protein
MFTHVKLKSKINLLLQGFSHSLYTSKVKKEWLTVGIIALAASIGRADGKSAFQTGEDLLFKIRWGVVTGGYATLSIPSVDQIGGQSAYHILSEARSTGMVETFYKVRDRNEAWMDTGTPRTLRYSKKIQEGKYRVDEVVELDQTAGKFHMTEIRHDKNDAKEEKRGEIPRNVLDVLSSFYYIRSQPLEVGKSFTVDVHSGDKTFPLLVNVKKLEIVKVKAGKFLCYRVEPVLRERGIFISKGKKMEVWMTADERHMPVLMRSEIFIGHVSAELVKHNSKPPKEDAQKLAASAKDTIAIIN